jgi:predicted acetyltransferase
MPNYLKELGSDPNYPYFDAYWQESGRFPYAFFNQDSELVGFAFVRAHEGEGVYQLAEFYIVPEHRRKAYGGSALKLLLSFHPGNWLLSVLPSNSRAFSFWKTELLDKLRLNPTIEKDDQGQDVFYFKSNLSS